jgi:hypothetical protein
MEDQIICPSLEGKTTVSLRVSGIIHDSSLGKGYPSCDKTYTVLLGTKPVERLVLNQSTWAKSEYVPILGRTYTL